MLTKSQIRELPEYIGLSRKHQQYVLFVTLWGKLHGTACRLLKLNKKRIADNEQIQDCIAAIRLGVRPPAPATEQPGTPRVIPGPERNVGHDLNADMAEVIRRIERLQGIAAGAQDPLFASTTFTYAPDTSTGQFLISKGLPLELLPDAGVTRA
jgi:hypothetical protein